MIFKYISLYAKHIVCMLLILFIILYGFKTPECFVFFITPNFYNRFVIGTLLISLLAASQGKLQI